MGDYKRPGRPKRQSKTSAAGAGWECSVCTFRNNQGAYTCAVCDARKGTATR
uniref:RanBP2-type domain-containing protein n=1 Tax=Eptatretus burgeri TaxID=7764 RepID=A0A8C4QYJ1_EPTBU